MYAPSFRVKTFLPQRKPPKLYTPSDSDIKLLLTIVQSDPEMERAILLAAFGPLRRGEICALENTDIRANTIMVNKSMVKDQKNNWIVKAPKTYSSYRTIEFPESVVQKFHGVTGRLVDLNPDQVTNRFVRILKKAGTPHFRFHDLRHYAASILHAIGVPDQYIMSRGGWSSDKTLKQVYRGEISEEAAKFNQQINKHFDRVLTTR